VHKNEVTIRYAKTNVWIGLFSLSNIAIEIFLCLLWPKP